MAYESEDLILELQKVGRELNRVRHGRRGGMPLPEGEAALGEGEGMPYPPHHEPGLGGMRGGPHGHGHGRHRCHGGSGRHGQNRILAVLMLADGTSQKDLAYLLGIRPQSLTQALEALEEGGLIERRTDEADKRLRQVFLTDAGRQRATKVAEDRKNYADEALSVLTEEEREQLGNILAKLSDHLAPKEPQE